MELNATRMLVLHAHESSVYTCKWNPACNVLASGSEDTTACILKFNTKCTVRTQQLNLNHGIESFGKKDKWSHAVYSVDWNSEGTHLATGSSDSFVRIWDAELGVSTALGQHYGRVFVVKWNKRGAAILSGGLDGRAIVWNVILARYEQKFKFHSGPVVDVDWQSDESFASCSSDGRIHVCKVGCDRPIKTFREHTKQVNVIKWDASGRYLASGSDDSTVKIWTTHQGKLLDLKKHQKDIYTVEWAPANKSINPSSVLATGSADATVRLWDIETGKSLYTLIKHQGPIFSTCFSPDGKYLASGSFDRYVHIWSTSTGELIRSFKQPGRILDVSWNYLGDALAGCTSEGNLFVLNLRSQSIIDHSFSYADN
ncbi:F-box-like/WD repeat-containing protein TBL1X [Dinothrombium tinctorium]|uniref:F-box-like/WD repeat-containing protein TBL1X n=1 Tax=Dinothrombium tinctorium TaxID=1965070 RepID=A0A3S4QD53_9ACAR|nr:F-box-like/WD repeat-containing protein TBL1X [Dinothrombium tinctorium]RWS01913.1 F-box-like/WD repeat-containing protein TBL1X [Dinothrombium tinctorium]RWS05209.1 F-box-like/WD repeat-containing protein TBL1X [Dinothrombium tinctorium]